MNEHLMKPGHNPENQSGPAASGRDYDACTTLIDVLFERAASEEESNAFVFLNEGRVGPANEIVLSYRTLMARSLALSKRLRAQCSPGDRVLIICPPGPGFAVSFFACQLATAIAVPADLPNTISARRKLDLIVADCAPALALTETTLDPEIAAAPGFPAIVKIDDDSEPEKAPVHALNIEPEETAWLQYNCEATGFGRGVVIPHRAALAQCRGISNRIGLDADATSVSTLPLTHNMGLIAGLLMPLITGCRSYIMPMEAFVTDPSCWLRAIDRYRASHVTAPAFVYRRSLSVPTDGLESLDLTSLRHALCGGEVLAPEAVQGFADRFARCGLRQEVLSPSYGLREAVSMITGAAPGMPPNGMVLGRAAAQTHRIDEGDHCEGAALATVTRSGRAMVYGAGRAIEGHIVRIVDPVECLELADGDIGEIWVTGPTVALGYWRDAEATEQRFGGRLADDPDGPAYLRTGYLGAQLDGVLYPLTSLQGSIMIRGKRHSASEIEAGIEAADPSLGKNRLQAFRTREEDREGVDLVYEMPMATGDPSKRAAMRAQLKAALASAHKVVATDVVLVAPGVLPRDETGRMRRGHVRHLHLAGALGAPETVSGQGDEEQAGGFQSSQPFDDPLLGISVDVVGADKRIHQRSVGLEQAAWLGDHRVYGRPVLPGVFHVALAVQSARPPCRITGVLITEPMIFAEAPATPRYLQFVEEAGAGGRPRHFEAFSREPAGVAWTLHAEGHIEDGAELAPFQVDIEGLRKTLPELALSRLDTVWRSAGLALGPAYDAIDRAFVGQGRSLTRISLPKAVGAGMEYALAHPVLLDASVRVAAELLETADAPNGETVFWAPWRIESVSLTRPVPQAFFAHLDTPGTWGADGATLTYDVHLLDDEGVRFGLIKGFTLRRAPRSAFIRASGGDGIAKPYQPMRSGGVVAGGSPGGGDLARNVLEAEEPERIALLTDLISEAIRDILGLDTPPSADERLFDFGLDSLKAMQLRNRLDGEFGTIVGVPATIVFDNPTISMLARHVADLVSESGDQSTRDASSGPDRSSSGNGSAAKSSVLQPVLEDIARVDDLAPPVGEASPSMVDAESIFLTGATGFLGRYILRALLATSRARITCLVRDRSHEAARARLISAVGEIGVDPEDEVWSERVRVETGDLASPDLGLSQSSLAALGDDIDLIIHNAASINLVSPYPGLRETNVLSGFPLLRLMTKGRPKSLHFVSTLGIVSGIVTHFSHDPLIRQMVFDEDTDIKNFVPDRMGYALTKWASEQIYSRVRDLGFSTYIYRPGLIIGDSKTGYYSASDIFGDIMNLFFDTRAIPEDINHVFLPWINVDRAASMILNRSQTLSPGHPVANIFEPLPMNVDLLLQAARTAGVALSTRPAEDWRRAAIATLRETPQHPAAWLLADLGDAEAARLSSSFGSVFPRVGARRTTLDYPDLADLNPVAAIGGSIEACLAER